jgi:hypothetical protein
MNEPLEWVKIGGSLAAMAVLAWRLIDEFGTYLRISVRVVCEEGHVKAITTVDNKGNRPKPIQNSFLLVGPEEESPIVTWNMLAEESNQEQIRFTDDLHGVVKQPVHCGQRAVITLPFYYLENVDIADETLSYTAPINTAAFESGAPYAVRFFLYTKGRLHRSTADTFFAPRRTTAT